MLVFPAKIQIQNSSDSKVKVTQKMYLLVSAEQAKKEMDCSSLLRLVLDTFHFGEMFIGFIRREWLSGLRFYIDNWKYPGSNSMSYLTRLWDPTFS